MFGCIAFCGPEWTWQPDPPLLLLALYTLSTGAIGMLTARRRPILSAVFVSFVVLSAFAVYLEIRDTYAGDSVLRMVGYLSGSALSILAGIGLSVLGALVGAKKVDESMGAWRWTSGSSGTVLLGLTLYAIVDFARNVYRVYFFESRRAINPFSLMHWQDIVAYACVLVALLFLVTFLLRSAFRPKTNNKMAASS